MSVVPMKPNPGRPNRRVAPIRRSPAVPARVQEAFTQALINEQLVTPAVVQSATQQAAKAGTPVHEVLVSMGFVEEQAAYKLLATAAELTFVDASTVTPSRLALKLIPERIARRHELLPVAVDDRAVTYLTASPFDVDADQDVRVTTGRAAVPWLTSRKDLLQALDRFYPKRMDVDSLLAKARSGSTVEAIEQVQLDVPTDSAIVDLCNTVVARAVDAGASDLHLDPTDSGILVRLRVGGVLEALMTLPSDVAGQVRNRYKVMGRADIAVRNRPQDGAFAIRVDGRRIDVRLSTLPTTTGEKLVMRIIDSHSELQSLDRLGYDDEMLGRLKRLLERPDGLLLVTGPTGSGKTTALYAALHQLKNGRTNIVSVEDPVERTLEGINQIPVSMKSQQTFASVLKSVLRQDPDVIMVGEIRDAEVAAIVAQAAFTGHLVLTSVHTIDAATAVTRLMNLGLEPYRIAESLTGILAQRLVRQLCPGCRVTTRREVAPGPGCDACSKTGYVERVPVAELLTPNDDIRMVIARGATAVEIRQAMRQAGMPAMRDHGRQLVAQGITSLEEVTRVLGVDDDAPAQSDSEDSPVKRQTILIADDEPITRTLVKLLLERDGYSVVEAGTGREALAQSKLTKPDLIVMDLNMPEMDGYEAIAEIRKMPGLAVTPIVVCTAEDGPTVEQNVLTLGADDYIVKPFEPAVLTARVKAVFKRQRLAA
jgi:type IV pilus assembly protein PilB